MAEDASLNFTFIMNLEILGEAGFGRYKIVLIKNRNPYVSFCIKTISGKF